MKILFFTLLFYASTILFSCAQKNKTIITSDIDHFWEAYDALKIAKSKEDSILTIQNLYLDRASEGLAIFMKIRELTAEKYVYQIKNLPEFWKSVRTNTLVIKYQVSEIEAQYDLFKNKLKKFKDPSICFAIGVLSTGGTVSDGWLLIGSEMVVADSTVNKKELNSWLQAVLPKKTQILEFTAHEMIHTQQRFGPRAFWAQYDHRLLAMAINEGAADFLAEKITGTTINQDMYAYGYAHEEELWKEFSRDMYGKDYSKWLYNGTNAKDRPADLGYFIGYRICQHFYDQAKDKEKALGQILKSNNYKKLLKQSGYGQWENKGG